MGRDEDRIRVPSRLGNWMLEQNLGSGYSGSIWRATNPFTGQIAAIKVQDVDHECPTNRYERNFYPSLQGGKGMPTLWAAGVQGDYDYLVIDLLGPSLDSLYRKNGKQFGLRSTISLAMQVISRLEFMHSRGILHRDIQLGNCVLGLGRTEKVIYMIDFGFSKRYIDPQTRKHIPDSRAKRDFIGNYWFSSVNVHCRGRVPSRRDDMEALALMLIHVLTPGGLPWTRNGVPKNDKAHDAIIRQKLRTRPEELCVGLPQIFEDFLRYCRRLKFFELPDYRLWRDQFADLARQMGYAESDGYVNDDFNWPPKPDEVPGHRPRKHNEDVDIYMVLEEIAKMRLEDMVQRARENGTLPQDAPAPEPPRLRPVALPPSNKSIGNRRANARSRTQSNAADGSDSTNGEKKCPPGVIVISDSSSEAEAKPSRQMDRTTKQAAMRLLTKRARAATDNIALADLLSKFLETYSLRGTSRVITRDAFEFLDALVIQLENPSVFIVKSSQSSTKGSELSNRDTNESARTETTEVRLRQRPRPVVQQQKSETVKDLRQRLQAAPRDTGNLRLAKMLADFCRVVRLTSGKTLTRDGVAFLEGIEGRLRQR